MNVHIALYKWKSGNAEGEIERALATIKNLGDKIPGVVEIVTAENTSKYNEGYTHVILVRGENQIAIDAYRAHPDHLEVAERLSKMEDLSIGVDFETQ